MGWVWIIVGVILEDFWASGLKYSDSVFLYFLTGMGAMCSIMCTIVACKSVEVSVAYAVFAGAGAGVLVLTEIFVFGGEFSAFKLAFIGTLLIGMIRLKLSFKEGDKEAMEELSELDEVIEEVENLGKGALR